ncbi:hypothetical protein ACHWQZ_G001771 [Mnemiopsis leidyi]
MNDVDILQSELLELEELLKSPECTVSKVEQFYQNGVNTLERMLIWKWLLGVSGSSITDWDLPVEHKDLDLITEDVLQISEMPEEQEKMIKILSYYCTARNTRYKADCGWAEVLLPLSSLSYGDMYACFYALLSKFVPRNCKADGKPFHLFRLLLLYHDPELCAFLDTKKCPPDLYAQRWFRSLYVGKCEIQVIREVWTRYLLQGDPFLVFYLALVILVNARDVILEMDGCTGSDIASKITAFPDNLSVEDIEDFVSLAKYYGERTPLSFRHDYHAQLFGNAPIESNFASLSQALCLPISVSELLQKTTEQSVSYLVVDCRPRDQFDSGHLPGAVHLDPDTMLSDPALFTTNVATVLLTQRKTFLEDEVSLNHLCFMGSSREEEDQLLNMVVAHFLHRKTQFVSSARDGYKALHDLLEEDVDTGLEAHNYTQCVVCCEKQSSRLTDTELSVSQSSDNNSNIVSKMSSVMKVTTTSVRSKLGSLWSDDQSGRHVTTAVKSKPYRGVESVFSIADEDDEDDIVGGASSSDDTDKEVINIKLWEGRADIIHCFEVEEITPDGKMFPSALLLTASHLYNVRRIPEREGMGFIRYRFALSAIARITAKKKHPDVITFKFIKDNKEILAYRFLIPQSKTVTSQITDLIPPE